MNVPQIGVNFEISGYEAVQCTGDPMQDAKNFADANNLSLEEAKKVLSGQFGNPETQESNNNTNEAKVAATQDEDAELVEDNQTNDNSLTLDNLKDIIKDIVTEILNNLGLTTNNSDNTTNNTTTDSIIDEVNTQLGITNTDDTTTANTDNATNTENTLTTAQQDALNHLSATLGYTLTGDNTTDITELNNRLGSIKYNLFNTWNDSKYFICATLGIDYSTYGSYSSGCIAASMIQEMEKAMAVLNGAVLV